ncbi:zinc ribbon domain-containing protein [Saccharolobus sp. A20]
MHPRFSLTSCPKCGDRIGEVTYKCFRCVNCGYENDKDVL